MNLLILTKQVTEFSHYEERLKGTAVVGLKFAQNEIATQNNQTVSGE
jgi:hypothetical protein